MKRLVTADCIRKLHKQGEVQLSVNLQQVIITPEAKDLMSSFNIKLIAGTDDAASTTSHDSVTDAVKRKLPPGKHDSKLIEQLVKKAVSEFQTDSSDSNGVKLVSDAGVVLVKGGSVSLADFEEAGVKNIKIADVIGSADKSRMGTGFLEWNNAFFPWTLTYDEIDVVLEGELHIKSGEQVFIGKPGDVMFIPQGASIEFGSPGHVRFVYVTYPADWA
ncbi:Ethanolamine utilization protein EutQ [Sinobacterium norvegicum]|uniref:Ethanolamine utilization protein EutQ n=1 Tax=Sinobacterium norvegicum TaxID=1641715 RepID=A0ABM9ABA1_9GAMM|nr:ethanolamine utilization acetate kinase EutQ [Sinobacterium norvegicum]CAH0990444.1 Ethanolamine utilization protein EutQ [Sinobacterium norvegicum]